MPPRCSVCIHTERPAIDLALVAGESFRNVAERFGTSATALFRHKAEHISSALVKAKEAAEVAQADSLLDQIRSLQTTTLRILDKAEQAQSFMAAIFAIREARGNLELLAKMAGELDERTQINIMTSPQWVSIQAVILDELADDPDRRVRLAARLAEMGA